MTFVPRPFGSLAAFRLSAALVVIALASSASSAWSQAADSQTGTAAAPVSTADHAASYYHYGLAKMYEDQAVQSGRQDLASQAIEQYKLALSADPDSRILTDGLANLYFNLGRVREAVSAAQDQVTKHPDDIEAHTLLGRTYLRSLGNGEGQQSTEMLHAAIAEYEKIAKLKPGDLETHLLLGQLYGLDHNTAKALAQFQTAQTIDPSSEEVVLSIARLYTEQGDLPSAAKTLAAVPAEDRTARINFALAGIYDQLKQPKDAVLAYRAVLKQDPDNADAKKALAQALLQSGDTDAAAKEYANILGTDPKDPQALIRQAEIERGEGKYDESLATLKKAEAQAPDDLELQYNEGLVYDALGRFDDAVKSFKAVLAATASPDGKYADDDKHNRWMFLDRLANVYREEGRTVDAITAYEEMRALGGDFAGRAVDDEIAAYRDAHNWAAALKVAADAAKEMPANHDIQLTYASQLADSGKLDEGIKLAQAQISASGTSADDRVAYFSLAEIYVRAKRWKDASAVLDKADAASTKPDDKAFVDYYRGHVADLAHNYDQAEIEFRKALALTADDSPTRSTVENDYGYMLAERGQRLDEAIGMIKKAVDADPQNGASLDSLAWAYYKQGQYALAENYERKALLRMNGDPTLHDHLADIEAKNGKLQSAVSEWEKSIKDYSSSLSPEADPADVAKVEKKLETARVKLAKLNNGAGK
jgi:tetratricopeptide (TPR) repeat protein